MRKTWEIGKVSGIKIQVHPTFFLLLLWVGVTAILSGGSKSAVFSEIAFILVLFLSVVLHELGHALAARSFGISTRDITLLPIGGVARLERMPEKPKHELIVAAAGPAVNVLIAGVLFVGLLFSGVFSQPLEISMLLDNFWLRLLSVNLTLIFFNLIPAFPMDGGRVLRAILASRMDYTKATRTAADIGRGFAILLGIAGIFLNPWLILTAIFIWSGAGAEANAVEMKADLEGLKVRDAMISQFFQVEANQPIESVIELSMTTGQQNIPVVSNGHFLGIIRRKDLVETANRLGRRAPAYAAIGIEPKGIDPDAPLNEILTKFALSRIYPVIEHGQLIGLITPESVQQQILLNKQLGHKPNVPPNEKKDTV